jgi:enamine deaminase RidA (YjgF/YER057c/UK114 family)
MSRSSRRKPGSRTALTLALTAAMGPPASAAAQPIEHAPAATNGAISAMVAVPSGYTTLYLSGTIAPAVPGAPPGTPAAYGGDTEHQTEAILKKLDAELAARHASLADIVMLRIYLVAAKPDGRMDFAGMNAAYARHFGTSAQPNKPARSTVQVAALVWPGTLVQIEAVAAVKPAP